MRLRFFNVNCVLKAFVEFLYFKFKSVALPSEMFALGLGRIEFDPVASTEHFRSVE